MADVTIANIAGGEDTSPANTSKIEIEVGGVSKFAQLVNILKNAIPIGGTTPAAGAFTTLKQTTGKAAGAIPISDADGALTLTASTGSGAPVRANAPILIGNVTNATLPAFLVGTGTVENVTGDATLYTIIFGTEIFDQGSNFDGTSTFTAPITGRYQFNVNLFAYGLTASHLLLELTLAASNRSIGLIYINPVSTRSGQYIMLSGSCMVDMDASDTATVTLKISNGTKVIGINPSYFSGFLVC